MVFCCARVAARFTARRRGGPPGFNASGCQSKREDTQVLSYEQAGRYSSSGM